VPNKRIETDGGKSAVALRGKVLGRRRSCVALGNIKEIWYGYHMSKLLRNGDNY